MSHERGWCLCKQLLGNFLTPAIRKLTPGASQLQRETPCDIARADKGGKTRHCAAISVFKADCTQRTTLSRLSANTHSKLQPFALLICSVPQSSSMHVCVYICTRVAHYSIQSSRLGKRASAGNPRKELVLQITRETRACHFAQVARSSGSVCVWEGK